MGRPHSFSVPRFFFFHVRSFYFRFLCNLILLFCDYCEDSSGGYCVSELPVNFLRSNIPPLMTGGIIHDEGRKVMDMFWEASR